MAIVKNEAAACCVTKARKPESPAKAARGAASLRIGNKTLSKDYARRNFLAPTDEVLAGPGEWAYNGRL